MLRTSFKLLVKLHWAKHACGDIMIHAASVICPLWDDDRRVESLCWIFLDVAESRLLRPAVSSRLVPSAWLVIWYARKWGRYSKITNLLTNAISVIRTSSQSLKIPSSSSFWKSGMRSIFVLNVCSMIAGSACSGLQTHILSAYTEHMLC